MRLMSGIVLGHLAPGTAAIVWRRDALLATDERRQMALSGARPPAPLARTIRNSLARLGHALEIIAAAFLGNEETRLTMYPRSDDDRTRRGQ
jgi:hypothetical protein